MELLNKYGQPLTGKRLSHLSDVEIAAEARTRFGAASLSIKPTSYTPRRQDIATWKRAVTMARNIENPKRQDLYNLYDNAMLDLHLTSIFETRLLRLQGSKFKIVDLNGKLLPEKAALLEAPWYLDYLKYAMEALLYGHSLIEIYNIVEGELKEVELINRKHVKPETGEYLIQEADTKGIDYRNSNLSNYYLEVGKKRDLGLLEKIAPVSLAKRYAFGAWGEYDEKIGIPFRTVTTQGRDLKRINVLQSILTDMGSAGWAVLQEDEKIELLQNAGSDPHKCFLELINLCDAQKSKVILGQTGTTDEKAFAGSAKVHQGVAEDRHEADRTFIEYLNNWELLPRLSFLGYPLQNCKYKRDETKDLDILDQIKIDVDLLEFYSIDEKYIAEKYNIPAEFIKKISPGNLQDQLTDKAKKKDKIEAAVKKTASIIAGSDDDTEDENEATEKPNTIGFRIPEKKHNGQNLTASISALMDHTCTHCGGAKIDVQAFAGKTEEQLQNLMDKLAKVLHDGDASEVDQELYFAYADLLKKGIKDGFGADYSNIDYNTPDNQMLAFMRTNVHVFSGAKSLQAIREMRSLLQDEKGQLKTFAAYKKDVQAVHKNYNVNYLAAEYDHAVASSQMAANWMRVQENKDAMPLLKYSTAGDQRVREAHQKLDGIVAPVESTFWNNYYPPNGWRCRCDVNQVGSADKVFTDDEATLRAKGMVMPRLFKNNPGKTGVVFNEEHPYLKGEDVNKWDAEKTYGLKSVDEINDRIPANVNPEMLTDQRTWEHDYKKMMEPHRVLGTDDYVLTSKIGDKVVFKDSFISHMEENKQMQEERWKLMPNIPDVLNKPDEVWTTSKNYNKIDEFNTIYIKYYNNTAIVLATNASSGTKGEIVVKTIYRSDTTEKQKRLPGIRKGVLMYRK